MHREKRCPLACASPIRQTDSDSIANRASTGVTWVQMALKTMKGGVLDCCVAVVTFVEHSRCCEKDSAVGAVDAAFPGHWTREASNFYSLTFPLAPGH